MKTIIHIMNYGAPYSGNFIKLINQLTFHLKTNHSIETIYILPLSSKSMYWVIDLQNKGYKIYFYPHNYFKNIIFYIKLIRREKPSLVHYHFSNTKNLLALKIASLSGKPFKLIYHCHSEFKTYSNPVFNYIRNMIISSDLYIGVSESVTKVLSSVFDRNKTRTVLNCIDFVRLDIYNPNKIKELNISNNKIVFLMFGYNYYIKGIDIAIESLKTIAEKKSIILAICVAKNKNEIKNKIIEHLGEFPKWIILLDPIEDIASYYNMADYFLSASRTEGFSYSLVEASYCNCLPISSDIEGITHAKRIPDLFLFENENSNDLSKLICKLLTIEKVPRAIINSNQREFIINNYSSNKWIQDIMKIYNEMGLT